MNLELLHVGEGTFEKNVSYANIISTFYRIYFIKEAGGEVVFGGECIKLEKGYIYLIPAFEPCSYSFKEGMSHYFVHCTLTTDKAQASYNLFTIKNRIRSIPIDEMLFMRLLEINPKIDIPHHDPNIYEKKLWMNRELYFTGINHFLETSGIVKQLFSRFIESGEERGKLEKNENVNLQRVFSFVRENFNKDISVRSLAEMSCLSTDHFSKVFKSAVGIGPCEFIINQRLNAAELYLMTTTMSLQEICQATNFKSLSYFSYLFKKRNKISPSVYRREKTMQEDT